MEKLYPGDICSQTGTYRAFTPGGIATFTTKKMVSGSKFPPTPFPGCYYKLDFGYMPMVAG